MRNSTLISLLAILLISGSASAEGKTSAALEPVREAVLQKTVDAEEKSDQVTTETVIQEGKPLPEISKDIFPGFDKAISADFKGMSVSDVLRFLAVEGSLNIAVAPDVIGVVNLLIKDVSIRDIFEIILATNHLAYLVQGNVITVISNSEFRILQGADFRDQRQTVIYQLKYASPQDLGTFLGNIKSDIGKIIFDDSTGMLVLIDTPEKIREMRAIVDKKDIPTVSRVPPTETKVYELKYALLEDVKEEIVALLTPEIGSMRTDIRTNTMVISDLPHQLEKISTVIKAFDRKPRVVFIEAKIVQVTLSDAFKQGIDWDALFNNAGGKEGLSLMPEINMPSGLTTLGKLTVARTTGYYDLNAILETVATVGETKILSNPHIATQEGKEASINVITTQPYSQSTTTTSKTGGTTDSLEFTFVEVGVKLNVTPSINADGYLSVAIKPEVSSITRFFPDSASEQRAPVIETADVESTVLVKDGTTIILAGMIRDAKTDSVNKVPALGNVPMIGKLFSNKSDEIQRTETVIFLTPRIVTGDDSYLLERDMIKEMRGIKRE